MPTLFGHDGGDLRGSGTTPRTLAASWCYTRLVIRTVLVGLVAIALAACHGADRKTTASLEVPSPVASNMLRADYAGSQACADCHADIWKAWDSSPMRNMTRDAKLHAAEIRAPFDGASIRVGQETARMELIDGERGFTYTTPTGTTRFRVTKVVGGHYREDFVGVDRDRPGDVEHVLPATYVFSTRSWRYKGYSVMVKERPAMSAKGAWAEECVPCHNVMPLATMLYDELYGPSLPPYQGKMSDRVLPRSKAWTARPLDAGRLAATLGAEIRFFGATPTSPPDDVHALLAEAAVASNERMTGDKLVELGVGCEACHNGSRAHVASPTKLPTFAAHSEVVAVDPPPGQRGTRAQQINHQCAKCHTVLFSRYPYTWEGGQRNKNPGGSTTNSGEGRDFQLGACASAMACTTCHDPHAVDAPGKLAALATPAGNSTCTSCHPKLAAAAAVAQHAHHAVGSAGTSCVACHMPKKNMGLDYGLVRYHRIGSPDDPARVTGDRPLECALCHRDQSIDTIVTTMERWWGKRYDREALHRLYGADLSRNALRAAFDGVPHEQAVAIATLGEARDATAIPQIVPHLAHAYPLVRFYAQRALQTITGTPVAIDLNQSAAEIRPQAKAWLEALAR